ncbi:hypothetical protein DENSPDRAFT_297041 [Dentipellis sp. KUC8613]|nr:hypothetical protein DENSPDRAFT_297041 [Dentipellis sp. KUC8613]
MPSEANASHTSSDPAAYQPSIPAETPPTFPRISFGEYIARIAQWTRDVDQATNPPIRRRFPTLQHRLTLEEELHMTYCCRKIPLTSNKIARVFDQRLETEPDPVISGVHNMIAHPSRAFQEGQFVELIGRYENEVFYFHGTITEIASIRDNHAVLFVQDGDVVAALRVNVGWLGNSLCTMWLDMMPSSVFGPQHEQEESSQA